MNYEINRIGFNPSDRTGLFTSAADTRPTEYPTLTLWGRGLDLTKSYYDADIDCDGHDAGVLADWLEDNAEECVLRTPGLTLPRLLMFVARLREMFADPDRNVPQ